MKKIQFKIFSIYLFLISISCSNPGNNTKNILFDGEFVDSEVKQIPVTGDIDIIYPDKFIGSKFFLSDIIADFQYLPLKLNDDFFISDIDKIIFNDLYIFILDRYAGKNLVAFDRKSGDQLFALFPQGQGPGEYAELYDFDVDFKNDKIFIHDGSQAKMLTYDIHGIFIEEKRMPFRIGNFRMLDEGGIINYTQHTSNDHLGQEISYHHLIITNNNNLIDRVAIPYGALEQKNNYYNRDYLKTDGNFIYVFPRFGSTIYRFDKKEEELQSVLSFQFGSKFMSSQDLKLDGEDFIESVKKQKKYFSNGDFFITQSGVQGAMFETFGSKPLHVFTHPERVDILGGTEIVYDVKGLPLFGFPFSVYKNEGIVPVSALHLQSFLDPNIRGDLKKRGMYHEKIDQMLSKINDSEDLVLLIMEFK